MALGPTRAGSTVAASRAGPRTLSVENGPRRRFWPARSPRVRPSRRTPQCPPGARRAAPRRRRLAGRRAVKSGRWGGAVDPPERADDDEQDELDQDRAPGGRVEELGERVGRDHHLDDAR